MIYVIDIFKILVNQTNEICIPLLFDVAILRKIEAIYIAKSPSNVIWSTFIMSFYEQIVKNHSILIFRT